ncbi:FAD dependent oxidoreductase [Halothece sp. PCC 7418]|uniref:NAD(P)/FAD-dependent oxidoreductase n=1 Tax=Halothece sp. (strain PCC 7418) TaxID=65093 RepID=UPI0002A05B6E|nr:FAD-binding oxidoreductase [Halothece sp. PCC 7418]AFZ44465.1 FAD dependent oxidoreductase [Halothece sp. PCC 7418]
MKRVLIIGGGIVGATIAYELSPSSDFDLTIIDQDAPAQASTGAALGILMGIISQKTKGRAWQLRETSLQRYPHLLEELREQTGNAIPHCQGLIHLCFSSEEMAKWQELVKLRHQQGWTLEVWDLEKLQTACPDLKTTGIIGAVYSPQDLQVQPQVLTQTLIQACQKKGVNCDWGVEATGVSVSNTDDHGECYTIETNRGTYEADCLIIAAGLGSFPLTRHLEQPIELRPVLGQAMRVRLPASLKLPTVVTGDDVHIVPLGNQEYWVGATVEFPDQPVTTPLDKVWEKAVQFCPALATGEILETWSGKRPRPEGQGAPVIQYLEGYQNVIAATGHYRNGVLLAPATARQVKEMVYESLQPSLR